MSENSASLGPISRQCCRESAQGVLQRHMDAMRRRQRALQKLEAVINWNMLVKEDEEALWDLFVSLPRIY